jgi:hypothetical protein
MFLKGHVSELTPDQFRTLVEEIELPLVQSFLTAYFLKLTKEQALVILPFLEKHHSQLPDGLFEEIARKAGPLGIVLFSKEGRWQRRRRNRNIDR